MLYSQNSRADFLMTDETWASKFYDLFLCHRGGGGATDTFVTFRVGMAFDRYQIRNPIEHLMFSSNNYLCLLWLG